MLLRLLIAALLFCCCAACHLPTVQVKPPLADEGEVFVYLEPFSQQESGLSFNLASFAAVRADGVELPLQLRLTDLSAKTAGRQRLVASAVLPAGTYRGFSCKSGAAQLVTEKGVVRLTPGDKPERLEFPFELQRGRGLVVSAVLRLNDAVHESSFKPAFGFFIPQRPLPLLTGYVTNFGSNNVTVFDKKAGSVREVLETGPGPKGIVIDRVQMRAYIAVSGEDVVLIVDVLSNEVINKIRLTYGDAPSEILLTADGGTLLTVNTGSNTVSFLDTASLLEVRRLNVGNQPVSIIAAPGGKRAYVFNTLSNSISVIDIESKSVTATLPTEPAPLRGAFNRRGDQLMVFYGWSPYLLLLDPVTLATLRRINVGMGTSFLKVDTATDLNYLGKRRDNRVAIYAPFLQFPSDFPSDLIRGTGGATYMLIDPEENNLLMVLPEQKALQTVNLISKKEVSLIDVGDEPFWSTIPSER